MQRIAVLEDDVATRATLGVALTDEGYQACLIEGPEDVLCRLSLARPDLVLLDLLLGAWGDGMAVARAIRADLLLMQVPIIVMSAAPGKLRQYGDELTGLQCQVLEKPFDLDDLFTRIDGALQGAFHQGDMLPA